MKIAILDSPKSRLYAKLAEAINSTQDRILQDMFVPSALLEETKTPTIHEVMDLAESFKPVINLPRNIYFSDHCLESTQERTFPESRHRSARIKKKLMKRFGGEFVMKPAIFQTAQGFFAHTSFKVEIEYGFQNSGNSPDVQQQENKS